MDWELQIALRDILPSIAPGVVYQIEEEEEEEGKEPTEQK